MLHGIRSATMIDIMGKGEDAQMIRASMKAQTGRSVCQTSIETTPKTNIDRKIRPYHHSGTWGYLDIKRAWISGCSFIERRDWTQICLRKKRRAWVRVAVIEANDRP